MYNWRKFTEEQQKDLLALRKLRKHPWHSPPHIDGGKTSFHLTASCFEHKHIIGLNPERMKSFETELLNSMQNKGAIVAWCVLPNHYHVLVNTKNILELLKNLGKLHGRTSFKWNGEENKRGRKVWFNSMETAIKSESHYFSTVNYIHNNPVHHGYVTKWENWPFGNAKEYLDEIGKKKAEEMWKNFPTTGYGKDWDQANF